MASEDSINQHQSNQLDDSFIRESVINDEITDFIEENSPESISESSELMNSCIKKIEVLRIQFRTLHHIIKRDVQPDHYEGKYAKPYQLTILSISNYIKTINSLFQRNSQSTKVIISQKTMFLEKEMFRSINVIKKVSKCDDIIKLENEDLKSRKIDLENHSKLLTTLSRQFKEYIELLPSEYKMSEMQQEYDTLVSTWNLYKDTLMKEFKLRELDKLDSFNKKLLNIKLQPFSGYNGMSDFYTFKSNFEKLYKHSVPKNLQADLLKNNHLEKQALTLVKNVTDIDDIWSRLKNAFGNCKTLLANKLSSLNNCDAVKSKDSAKIIDSLSIIMNLMRDLMQLASTHNIENELYFSDALDIIYNLLGESRTLRWLSLSCESPKDGKWKWRQLLEFLDKEINIHQQRVLSQTNSRRAEMKQSARYQSSSGRSSHHYSDEQQPPSERSSHHSDGNQSSTERPSYNSDGQPLPMPCYICGSVDHVQTSGPQGRKLVQYFACKKFVEMSPIDRFNFLKSKNLCFQCLYPGAQLNQGKHQDGRCQRDFTCQHPSHQQFTTKKHVLVCDEHKTNQQNKDIFEHYKSRCIIRQSVPTYSKEIKLSFHARSEENHNAIFMLQSIPVDGQVFTIFYDSGCSDFICRQQAIQRLGSRATQEFSGTVIMGGVGGITSEAPHGIYSVQLPLINGNDATMSGVCMSQITQRFPNYPLNGKVIKDIHNGYASSGGNPKELPSVPAQVGGDIDFMVGVKYLRYFPEVIYQLPSGLTIYKSHFKNVDGSTGVIGGPHEVFSNIQNYHQNASNFIKSQHRIFQQGFHIDADVRLLGYTDKPTDIFIPIKDHDATDTRDEQSIIFEQAEHAGSELLFRCVNCRGCNTCNNLQAADEVMSIKEEIEQDVINRSVNVDTTKHISIATLPLMDDPSTRLIPNRDIALKVYNQQLKRLSRNPKDKDDVLKSEKKLHSLGYVQYVKDFPAEIQHALHENSLKNFIPWRAVWKESSISTPCRVVFDASMLTRSGYSLNDILAKGRNNMNKLVEIFIRWRGHSVGFHTDIAKMYNSIQLHQSHWCLQRYLWEENLDPSKPPEEKIIKTLIYGVKSSGNQAERGLRETARLFKEEYPEVHNILSKDVYVDDCISGHSTPADASIIADQLEVVVNRGGFTLKGFTFSHQHPPENLSADGETVSVAGLKWYSKDDEISLDIQELNFSKKNRGRKPQDVKTIPEKLTRRQCVSKVAELFDLTGLLTPIIATMKIDLHILVNRKLDWDDVLPDELRPIWLCHFEMMKEIKNIKFKRAVVPVDAVSLDIDSLDFGDASQDLVCAAIYVRFKRRQGSNSCQLVFARSRLVPDGMSQPRAEMYAALINAHTGDVVRKAFSKTLSNKTKFTDSQIVLHWISNKNLQLKQWVRNRVAEIHRLTDCSQWKYVRSEDMIADLGTRRCASLQEVDQHSSWINGFTWMQKDESCFPAMSAAEIILNNSDVQEINKEAKEVTIPPENNCFINSIRKLPEEVAERYKFSDYLIDPNLHQFERVVRILAIVMRFLRNCQLKIKHQSSKLKFKPKILLNNNEIDHAEKYFFKKASEEIKHFLNPAKYSKISQEKDGILHYIGRILPTDSVSVLGNATEVMTDLTSATFCVPLIDRYSPLAYSIIYDVHWNSPTASHSGNETTWRHVLKKAFIIEGKSLVKIIRSSCKRCRYLLKKSIAVEMGPLSQDNLQIAPAFYVTQVDLAGPFQSYSLHHRRTTVKLWLLVFCCATTTCTSIKVMEDYSTTAFIQSFTRFSCQFGYPKKLLIDEGSQLVKGCETVKFDINDLQYKLHRDVKVEFDTCPVGGHNMHGRVERKIKEIRSSLKKSVNNQRLSLIQWETISSIISNSINNMPIAINNIKADLEMMDLITPNRLLLGRNNERSPTGTCSVENDSDKIIRNNRRIFDSWFECWLTAHVPNLMVKPKWFKSDVDLKSGDVVLFLKQESVLCSTYQYGVVRCVERGRDGRVRTATVKYTNANENCSRETVRSVRSLVVIHDVDEIDISRELFLSNSQ